MSSGEGASVCVLFRKACDAGTPQGPSRGRQDDGIARGFSEEYFKINIDTIVIIKITVRRDLKMLSSIGTMVMVDFSFLREKR